MTTPDHKKSTLTTPDHKLFTEGSRDETLFHIANCLVKGGMQDDIMLNVLTFIASNCEPKFPEKEAIEKIKSALNRSENKERNLAKEVKDFVLTTSGHFLTTECHNGLQVTTRREKKSCTMVLLRMLKDGIIERYGNKNGCYRRIENDCEIMDFTNAETETVNLWMPFGINQMVETMPGNIIVLAGEPNAGKTAFLLNVIRENMKNFEVHYFNSEMGPSELRKRLDFFDDITVDDWKFKAWERAENFGDVIKSGPGKINIIDFLEIHDNFYEIGGKLAEIHKKLKGALAIIALQKNPGVSVGLGGFRGLEKPRLYLTMGQGKLSIVKAKNWKTMENPNGKELSFKLVNGCQFIKTQGWHKPG